MAVAGGDDLIEEVGRLLVEGKISKLVNDQQNRFGVNLEFANQGMIHLRSQEMVEHIHGGGEQDPLVGLTGAPADDPGEICLTHAGITDDADAGAVTQEVEIEQTKNAGLELESGLVMVEVEAVDGRFALQAREFEAAFDGTLVAGFELTIDEGFKSLSKTEIFGGGVSQDLIQMKAHRRQIQLLEFLLQ